VRFLRDLRRGRLSRSDCPDGLVREDEVVVGVKRGELPLQDAFGLAALAFPFRLADAGDDEHSCR